MPFTPASASKHKKGLSKEQKAKWSKIANNVRQECLDNGGNESVCDGRAIRIANSQVGKKK